MTDQEILGSYLPMVRFLAHLCGPSCEVLLHDVSDSENSVVAIENGFLSGREVGAPMTDLALKVMETEDYRRQDFLADYVSTGNGKDFVSSTYFIKNGDRLIGLLCVNRDMSVVSELDTVLRQLKQQYNLTVPVQDAKETLDLPVSQMLRDLVADAVREYGILPRRLSIEERVSIVHKLAEQGVLGMKGAVSEIARQLQVSEPTVYRYISRERGAGVPKTA